MTTPEEPTAAPDPEGSPDTDPEAVSVEKELKADTISGQNVTAEGVEAEVEAEAVWPSEAEQPAEEPAESLADDGTPGTAPPEDDVERGEN